VSAAGNALIVGGCAAKGLGAAAGRVFAAAGFDVTIAGRNAGKLDEAAKSIAAAGRPPRVAVGDVTRAEDVARFVATAMIPDLANRFGPDGMLEPDQIAANYLTLHRQHRSAWTHELDLRPWSEKF
jgi:NAD(P)-dependent dehydrogenase (short-subunit alcohol dehydrogenase family)